jgi:predicted nuclease of predicted toxin-antitoxin system
MRLLLDECMPRRFKRDFVGYGVSTVEDVGLKGVKNGRLLEAASAQFDVLLTVDRNLIRQHKISDFKICVIVLVVSSNRYSDLFPLLPKIGEALTIINPGGVIEISGRGS